jgi:hypothetical protein
VHGYFEIVGIDAVLIREARLRVEIDHENAFALLDERRRECVHSGGLGHSALLIRNSDDRAHEPIVDARSLTCPDE